jgi:hypothetical protein
MQLQGKSLGRQEVTSLRVGWESGRQSPVKWHHLSKRRFPYDAPSALNAKLKAKSTCRQRAEGGRKNPERDKCSDRDDEDAASAVSFVFARKQGISYTIVNLRPRYWLTYPAIAPPLKRSELSSPLERHSSRDGPLRMGSDSILPEYNHDYSHSFQ